MVWVMGSEVDLGGEAGGWGRVGLIYPKGASEYSVLGRAPGTDTSGTQYPDWGGLGGQHWWYPGHVWEDVCLVNITGTHGSDGTWDEFFSAGLPEVDVRWNFLEGFG